MKKIIVTAFLILSVVVSLIAGTLAMYTTTLDDLADGSVVAKEFIFMEDGTDTFAHQVKIAPTETIVWEFAVRNYDGAFITETDLYYHLIFDVTAFPGKQAIDPLIVTVKDENGVVLDTVTGTGTINIYDAFMLSEVGQRAGYSVEFYWPSNDEIDINYAGESFSTAINVSATASQLPFDMPPEEPETGDASLIFQTSDYWTEGAYWDPGVGGMVGGTDKYKFNIKITNTSDTETIENWNLGFVFEDEILSYWNCRMVSYNAENDSYLIIHPENYNINIAPGQTIEFGGIAVGHGETEISEVKVNDMGTAVEYQFGVIPLD